MNRRPLSFLLFVFFALLFFALVPAPALAQIAPKSGYEAENLPDPDLAPMPWVSSMAYYDGRLIYAGSDGNVRAFDPDTGVSEIVADLSGDLNFMFGPSGFLVSDDGYLYFGDNGNTKSVYRLWLSDRWPADAHTLATGASGSIFSFAQNPGTHTIWFASADFGGGNMYLYEVPLAFNSAAVKQAEFTAPHGGGSGPIIFIDATTVLYGESPFGGDGYFHLLDLDAAAREVLTVDYLVFDGGLAGAVHGFDDKIYVSTGAGMKVYRIDGPDMKLVATTDQDAQGLAFDGETLFLSLQKPWRNLPDDGEISFGAITEKPDTGGGGGGGGGCFVRSTAGEIPKAGALSVLLCLAGALLATMAVRAAGRGRSRPRVD